MKPDYGCDRCRMHDPTVLEKIGDVEREHLMDGKCVEEYTHYKCKECGSNWIYLEEDGLGGHASSWSPR